MADFGERLRRGWNAFLGRNQPYQYDGSGFGGRPDRNYYRSYNSRSIMGAIFNRIAVDFASLEFNHVMVDEDGNFKEVIRGPLNDVLSSSSNLDQTPMALMLDAAMMMFNEGTVALAPVYTSDDPAQTESYKIYTVRVAKITTWYKTSVEMEAYDEFTGQKKRLVMPKSAVVIVENPFYSIMNEPNSLLQRLLRLLNQIDRTNEQNSSGKLDLILQLPYVIRGEAKRREAEQRRKDIEDQLMGAQLGIAYVDGTEKITQLNRAVENNLWAQAKDLQEQLYNQLGLTKSIFDGTASEAEMLNYQNRTIEVMGVAFQQEMERKWLSKTARTQHQAIRFRRDPFKLVPAAQMAEIADKFTRNEILTSNEIRAIVGRRPSKDPKADKLINSNISQPNEGERDVPGANEEVSNFSATSSSTENLTRIQNGRKWLNQIGTLSTTDLKVSK